MSTPLTVAQIQQAYVAFFSRPADPAGLAYWLSFRGNQSQLFDTFAQSLEYTARFAGRTIPEQVTLVYQQLLGRDPETAGFNYWVGEMQAGRVTVANLAHTIANAALAHPADNTDRITVERRVEAATNFTTAVDTPAEIQGYTGALPNEIARDWLSTINHNTPIQDVAHNSRPVNSAVALATGTGGDGPPITTPIPPPGADMPTSSPGVTTRPLQIGGPGGTVHYGTDGADVIVGENSVERIDVIDAGSGADTIFGLAGDDQMHGFFGDNVVDMGDGNDAIGLHARTPGENVTHYINRATDSQIINTERVVIDHIVEGPIYLNLTRQSENLEISWWGGSNGAPGVVIGTSGNNVIVAGQGNDTIDGWTGNDEIMGRRGDDVFMFSHHGAAHADAIVDFDVQGNDSIHLRAHAFGGNGVIGPNGVLAASAFHASATGTATTAEQRILFNTSNGQVWFDADGNGAGAASLIANLTRSDMSTNFFGAARIPTVTHEDFAIVA